MGSIAFMTWSLLGILVFICIQPNSSQLVVNIRNEGGDIYQQSILANTSLDTVTLEYKKADGTLITQFIDFRNEVQIFRAVIMGEEERGQITPQNICFVTKITRNEFISSDAMSKLRQKNPGAVRRPEEDKGVENLSLELVLDVDQSHLISAYLPQLCARARDAIHTRDQDLKLLSRGGKDYSLLLGATRRSSMYRVLPCPDIQELWRPCLCHYRICVGWYPCGLKYCKGKDSTGKVVSYRCGIKTCGKCRDFEFYSRRKQQCMWDEHPWGVKRAGEEDLQPMNAGQPLSPAPFGASIAVPPAQTGQLDKPSLSELAPQQQHLLPQPAVLQQQANELRQSPFLPPVQQPLVLQPLMQQPLQEQQFQQQHPDIQQPNVQHQFPQQPLPQQADIQQPNLQQQFPQQPHLQQQLNQQLLPQQAQPNQNLQQESLQQELLPQQPIHLNPLLEKPLVLKPLEQEDHPQQHPQ